MSRQRPLTPIESNNIESLSPPRLARTDVYDIHRFTEDTNYEMAQLAWRIHAEGYESMRFVKSSAVTDEGYLENGIDKSRGEYVDYYIATKKNTETGDFDAATLRKINLPIDGTVDDLPAYQLCRDNLYEEGEAYIRSIADPDVRLKEIGAMARTETAGPLPVFELLRNGVHEALGKKEVWLSSIVSTTYASLVDNFGHNAIRQIGDPVTIEDDRVEDSIILVPTIVDVDTFFDDLYNAMAEEGDARKQYKMMRSLLFFTDGISDEQLGLRLATVRSAAYQNLEAAS